MPELTPEQAERMSKKTESKGFGAKAPFAEKERPAPAPFDCEPPSDTEKATEGLIRSERKSANLARKQRTETDAAIVQSAIVDEIRSRTLYTDARTQTRQIIDSPEFEKMIAERTDLDEGQQFQLPETASLISQGLTDFFGNTPIAGSLSKMLNTESMA